MRVQNRVLALAGLVCVAAACGTAAAQGGRVLELEKSKRWVLRVTVNLRAYQDARYPDRLPTIDRWSFDTGAVVFPLLAGSASHTMETRGIVSQLTFNDRVVDTEPTLLTGYQAATQLGRWDLVDKDGRECELKVEIPVTCYNTLFHEDEAKRIGWPDGDWPPDAKSTLATPQMFIDYGPEGQPYDMAPIERAVDTWTNGDPKSVPPVVLAKWIAGNVMEAMQPSGSGVTTARTGQVEGIDVIGAPAAALRGRGTEFDIVCVLTAAYRKAGLPARTVIGFYTGAEDDDDFLRGGGRKELRGWVEFCLYDEPTGRETWVPVDLARMRKRHSRLPTSWMDKPLAYFGTHDELVATIPFAFQFHPPTTVQSYGSPAFWGWMVTPEPPTRAFQSLTFDAMVPAVRAEDMERDRDDGGRRRP